MSSARSARSDYGPKSAQKNRPNTKREASPGLSNLEASPTKKHRNLLRQSPPLDSPPVGFAPSLAPAQESRRFSFGTSDEISESTYALGTPGVSSFGRTIKPSHKAAEMLSIKREPASDNAILQGLNALFEESTSIVTPRSKKEKARSKEEDSRLPSPLEFSDDDDLPLSPFEGYDPKSRQQPPALNPVRTVIGSPIVISDSDDDKPALPQDGALMRGRVSQAAPSDGTLSESDPYYDERAITDPEFEEQAMDARPAQEIPDDVIEAQIRSLRKLQAMQSAQRHRSTTVSTPKRRLPKDLRSEQPSSKDYSLKETAGSSERPDSFRSARQESSVAPAPSSAHVTHAKGKERAETRAHAAKSGNESEEWESITSSPKAPKDGRDIEDAADIVEAEETVVVDNTVCELLNTAGQPLGEGRFLNMDIVRRFAPEAYTPALAALRFKKTGPFLNLVTHGFSGDVTVPNNRVVFKSSGKNVVGIMLGGLSQSNIADPHIMTNKTTGATSYYKRIAIAPTETYMYGFRQFIRSAFGEATLRSFMSTNADLSFSTKKEGTAASTVPEKDSTFYPPKNVNPKVWYSADFPNCLEYESDVKIYDCRGQEFMFDEASFRRLKTTPLYSPSNQFRNTPRELPKDAIVAVAFTMSTWSSTLTKAKNLSLNVQFGLLLGQLDHAHA